MQLPYSDIATPHVHRLDAAFVPPRCPRSSCPTHTQGGFDYRCIGTFDRKVDKRVVQRFKCKVCRKGFSSQTFRVDYRLKKPWLPLGLFQGLVSKTSLRQTARNLGSKLDTMLRLLERLGLHSSEVHQAFLERHRRSGGWKSGEFQLDELETFEIDRRLCPLTVPILIHKDTRFVVHTDTATLPARGHLSPRDRVRKQAREAIHGKRVNGSKPAVTRSFSALAAQLAPSAVFEVQTDEKKTYPSILRAVFEREITHRCVNSKVARGRENLLFPINNVLAQTRDNLGRLVRRNWGHSKRERNLGWHLAVWMLYRNYVRERSRFHRHTSSATDAGVAQRPVQAREILAWRGALPAAA
jgi:transposase-like protein